MALFILCGVAQAATIRDADSANSLSTLFSSGGRRLDQLAFAGSSTIMTGADFLRFSDGYLREAQDSTHPSPVLYGWTSQMPRDVSTSGNKYDFNPDRADRSTSYAGENNPRPLSVE